ncbi:MAG: hypothetical protein M3R13_11120 [Armatimonadota bacterium]|nr:hypothetical protein [Armatimonadota bacterium]
MNKPKQLKKRHLQNPYSPNEYRTSGDDSGDDSGRNSSSVFIGLLSEVRRLRFSSFQICVFLWLNSKGFRSVRVLDRRHRVGRRSVGGVDFVAKLPDSDIEIAVQLRHWRSPLQPRVANAAAAVATANFLTVITILVLLFMLDSPFLARDWRGHV